MSLPTSAEVPVDVAVTGLCEHLHSRPFPFVVEADLLSVPDAPGIDPKTARLPIPVLVLDVPAGVDRRSLPLAWPDPVHGHPVITRVRPASAVMHDPAKPEVPRGPGARRWFGR